ncbi:MAG: ABC transporter permease [Anaerolineaceae bacterium]|nr:ABC transporter permease [Anaerolineaceae bacterium]
METTAQLTHNPPYAARRTSPLRKYLILLWRSRTATAGALILLALVLTAIFQQQIATHNPASQNIRARLTPPAWSEGGDPEHLLGTDQLGRDIFSRMVYGVRISLFVGFTGVLISGAIGCVLGLASGYFGGVTDTIIMRFVDVFLAFPFLLLAITFVVTLGPSLHNIIIVLGITGWVSYARLVRGQTLSLREQEYVQAARLLGASDFRIIFRHILPNLIAPVIIYSSMEVGIYIIVEASLTFLGMGIPPSIPT